MKIAESGSESIRQKHGSADSDPYQNVNTAWRSESSLVPGPYDFGPPRPESVIICSDPDPSIKKQKIMKKNL